MNRKIRVGDKVRVKLSVEKPHYGWGVVLPHSVGIVTFISDLEVRINFPGDSSWCGLLTEMELV